MMTTTEHPGVTALKERIARFERQLDMWDMMARKDDPAATVADLEHQLAELTERLERARARLANGDVKRGELVAYIEKLNRTLSLAREDDRVAQAVWLKLLVDRSGN